MRVELIIIQCHYYDTVVSYSSRLPELELELAEHELASRNLIGTRGYTGVDMYKVSFSAPGWASFPSADPCGAPGNNILYYRSLP